MSKSIKETKFSLSIQVENDRLSSIYMCVHNTWLVVRFVSVIFGYKRSFIESTITWLRIWFI